MIFATCFIVEKFSKQQNPEEGKRHSNITEIMVEKEKNGLTLGDLRNIALAQVPVDQFWVTFDDDDVKRCRFEQESLQVSSIYQGTLKKMKEYMQTLKKQEANGKRLKMIQG
ncbi:hypothetical protein BDK51DRAFT_31521 [Blyttiomyces helicus]|uniref:Uncharacterized protein n=1 Tax=Blyttiomyces helicus TaxID=388810 RepID=A0A4P9WT44_9FUNG|nr:hypothetical protein BDK51DRAFT_31521 [Blyttiomyces helicus]|eukprot:RKO94500.1 hypothetical protein BDK51DRAFT_31521 [Blyttiomyces helicus]